MKTLILFVLFAAAALGQIWYPGVFIAGTPPGGIGAACTATTYGYLNSSGQVITCQSNAWTVVTGSGSMTWPGGAGFALYGGSSAWGTSFVPASTAVPFGNGTTFLQDATNFNYVTGTHALTITGPMRAASFGTGATALSASGGEQTLGSACPGTQTYDTWFFSSANHIPQFCLGSGTTVVATDVVPLAAPGSDHKWVFYVDNTGTQQRTQPAMGDISGTLGLAAGGTNVDLSSAGGTVNTNGTQLLHDNASHVISSSALITQDIPTAHVTRTVVFTDIAPVVGDDGLITVLNPATAIHLTKVSCGQTGATSIVVNLVKATYSLLGTDMTVTAGDINTVTTSTFLNGNSQCGGTTSCAVAAHAPVTVHIGTNTGTATTLACSIDCTVD